MPHQKCDLEFPRTASANGTTAYPMRGWAFVLIMVCLLPWLAMMAGMDFSSNCPLPTGLTTANEFFDVSVHALRGGFTHTILEWTAVLVAFFVMMLCFVQYGVTRKASLPVIGTALACAGAMDAFHILTADRLISATADNRDLIPFTWALCRLFNAVILLVGVEIFAHRRPRYDPVEKNTLSLWAISLCFVGVAVAVVCYCVKSDVLPQTMFHDSLIKRPYDLLALVPYILCAVLIFPKYHARQQTSFSAALSLSLIPQIATQLYMMLGSEYLFDASFNIAHGLKIISYAILCVGLTVEYVHTHRKQHETASQLHRSGTLLQYSNRVLEQLAGGESMGSILKSLAQSAEACSPDMRCTVQLLDETGKRLLVAVAPSLPAFYRDAIHGIAIGTDVGSCGAAATLGYAVEIKDIATHPNCQNLSNLAGRAGLHACRSVPILSPHGMVVGVLGMYFTKSRRANDFEQKWIQTTAKLVGIIVERTRSQQALEVAREEAEAANRAKSEFLATMSHEIRTPMTAIIGFADVLLGEEGIENAPPERREAFETIDRNSKYLLALINDILDLSKIEAGKFHVEKIPCSPTRVLEEMFQLMQVRASAKNIEIRIEYDGSIPETIHTDPVRLRQILINLVGNAIKFTELGKVRVVVRLIEALTENPHINPRLQFDIIDTGIGITEAQMERLFKPFSQADTSTTRKYGGTGLGLTISQRLTKMLGDEVTVSSVPGKGTTFQFSVDTGPLAGVPLIDPAKQNTKQDTKQKTAQTVEQLNCRILLAEDGPDNQRLISFVLRKAGADVTLAENGRIAVDKILAAEGFTGAEDEAPTDPFDIVLMDMSMPEMDGYEATRALRAAGFLRPIIALTAHAMASDRQECLDAGCTDYASKPIDRAGLIAMIAGYVMQMEPGKF